jgi:hypothetical protein
MQEWRNWQTRRLQVPVVAISCGFKSHLLHKKSLDDIKAFLLLQSIRKKLLVTGSLGVI